MATLTLYTETAVEAAKKEITFPADVTQGKRHLTAEEIAVLEANGNNNLDDSWQNVLVDAREGCFDPQLIPTATSPASWS